MLWVRHRVGPLTLLRWVVPVAVALYVVPALLLDTNAFYFGPLPRFGEILAGAALALFARSRTDGLRGLRVPHWLVCAVIAVIAVYVLVAPDPKNDVRWVGIPIAVVGALVLVAAGYAGTEGPAMRLLRWGPVTALGRVSYSLYLWHVLPLYLLDKDQIALPTPVLGLLGVGMACLFTWLSYLFLERPFVTGRSDALAPAAVQRA